MQVLIHHKATKISTPSTLLIPARMLLFFNLRKRQFKSVNQYFIYLLFTYSKRLNKTKRLQSKLKWKKQYQTQGLKLTNICFLPDPGSWEAWRQISHCFGLSICYLFVFVMEIDYQDWIDLDCPEEVPEFPIKLEYRKTYPFTLKKTKNSRFRVFSFQKIEFETETLTRGGKFKLE